jgi:hypothetical protein
MSGQPKRQRHVLLRGERGHQVERLEDEPDLGAAQPANRSSVT